MPFWRLFYHAVWATQMREPLIDEVMADAIQRSVRATGQEHRRFVHAVGVMPDHVHVAFSAPPSAAPSSIIGKTKGSSSHLMNSIDRENRASQFAWQSEYGVLSFGDKALPD